MSRCPFADSYRHCDTDNCAIFDKSRHQCSFLSIAQQMNLPPTPVMEYHTSTTVERLCKTCDYCHWEVDAAGDEIEYRCIRDIYPKIVEKYHSCDCWRSKSV